MKLGRVLALALLLAASPSAALASGVAGATGADGHLAKATREQVANLGQGRSLRGNALATPWEYGQSSACPQHAGPTTATTDTGCSRSAFGCPPGEGPLVTIWGRAVDPALRTPPESVGWERLGTTCFGDMLPGSSGPTLAMIQNAFVLTPWARATVSTQPVGNVSLVTLPTFFQATWQAKGYQPGEINAIDPSRMLGYRVDVRPSLVSLTYDYGDGASSGRTTSLGGVYPNGDITHVYRTPGTYSTGVTVVFGGEYRLNGGPWMAIDTTATVAMPTTVVTVKEARAVLVPNG